MLGSRRLRPARSRWSATAALAALAVLAPACSGGGASAPTSTGAGSTSGPTTAPTATGTGTGTGGSPTTTPPSGTTRPPVAAIGRSGIGLRAAAGCPALLEQLHTLALAHVTGWGFDTYGGMGGYYRAAADSSMAGAATTAAAASVAPSPVMVTEGKASSGGALAAGGSSTTNVQEEGIDEGDLVENDGRYVYSVLDGRLRVVDTVDASVDVVELPASNGQHQLVLSGDRLVVVTGGWGSYPAMYLGAMVPYGSYATTTVTVLDVSAPEDAKVVEQRRVDGMPVAVRAAGGTVRIVLSSVFGAGVGLVQPAQTTPSAEARAKAINVQAVKESTIEAWLPQTGGVGPDGTIADPQPALACEQLQLPAVDSGLGLTWIASVDLGDGGKVQGSAGVVAQGGTTYASATNLYVTTTAWQPPIVDEVTKAVTPAPVAATTEIHQFEVGQGAAARYVASGSVPGRLFSAYAMSEHDGVLRVAATVNGTVAAPDGGVNGTSSSAVHALRRDGDELKEIGTLDGLGKDEQIYAVRFIGTYGYVVTFRRTDPLFVVDLRDPTKPTLAGSLELPGYSSYLHPVGDGLLLGIGQSADEQGMIKGLQVSLFDVRDPAAPTRLANTVVGGYSPVEWDPHAFLYWAPNGTAYIARTPWYDPAAGDVNSVAAVKVDGDTLAVTGKVPGPGVAAGASMADPAVQERLYQADVQRTMIVDGRLVLVAMGGVRVADADSLSVVRDAVWSPYGG